jgi:hypothetical protein
MPALQETLDHFDALPSSLTGISFYFALFRMQDRVNPAAFINYYFRAPAVTGVSTRVTKPVPAFRKCKGMVPYDGSDFTSR